MDLLRKIIDSDCQHEVRQSLRFKELMLNPLPLGDSKCMDLLSFFLSFWLGVTSTLLTMQKAQPAKDYICICNPKVQET
jgi:hypothetical protein